MRSAGFWTAIALLVGAPGFAAQAQPPPRISPGTYSATYTCMDGAPLPVDVYVLDQSERVYKVDETRYQKVRVEAGPEVFVGHIIINGMGRLRIAADEFETPPSARRARLWAIDIDSFDGGLRGTTKYERDLCRLVPRNNPNAKTVAQMSFPTRKAVLPPAYESVPLPNGYAPTSPPRAQAADYSRQARDAIRGDAENWNVNRLNAGSIGQDQFYGRDDGGELLLRLSFTYVGYDGFDTTGWAEARFRGGTLLCVRFFDRATCSRPRPSRAQQLTSLGQGKPALGPVVVPASCFRTEQRKSPLTPVYRTVRVGPSPQDVQRRIDRYEGGASYTVDIYQCAARRIEIDCIAEGTDRIAEWVVGTGASRDHGFDLTPGSSDVSRAQIAELNDRIARKTCVRTR